MSDIADVVGVAPSAVYRHFPGKRELLAEVVEAGLRPIIDAVDALPRLSELGAVRGLTRVALDEHHAGVLWQREARHLRPEQAAAVRAGLSSTMAGVRAWLKDLHPELGAPAARFLAGSLMAAVVSPSFHRVDVARSRYEEELEPLLRIIIGFDASRVRGGSASSSPQPLLPASRREALLARATSKFAEFGFDSVSMEDIAGAVGIAGPSVYNHVSTKVDLLSAAFRRTTEVLFSDIAAAYRRGLGAEQTLRQIVRSYIDFGRAHDDVIGLLITGLRQLPADEERIAREAQRDFLGEWVHLLRIIRPERSIFECQVRVFTAVDIVNDAARVPRLRNDPTVADVLESLVDALLEIGPPPSSREDAFMPA